jgi:transcriptional regulator with XRE-family HTH domain
MVISNETSREEIGKRIERFRTEKGLTQQQVADALYVDRVTISQWENGFRDIKTGNMVSLAEYFGVSCDYLLGRTRTTAPDDFIQEAVACFGLNEQALEALSDKTDSLGRRNILRVSDTMLLRDLLNETLTSKEGQQALKTLAKYCFSKIELGADTYLDYTIENKVDDKRTYLESQSINADDLREVVLTHFCTQMRRVREKLKGENDGKHN